MAFASTGALAKPAGRISAGRLRLATFAALTAFMIGGPVLEQVFGFQTKLIRSWIMFSVPGIGLIDASFTVRQPDGTFAPLDRFVSLGEAPAGKLKRIDNRDELASVIKRLCAAAGQEADIRVVARQAVRSGWKIRHSGAQNVCAD